ncbi:hypothetical protein CDD83_7067 [Cordyceps sp. RAO-2017]|nr:hypothetical protein CDD83_7067 [Cordyceps sp. RAO-2017]
MVPRVLAHRDGGEACVVFASINAGHALTPSFLFCHRGARFEPHPATAHTLRLVPAYLFLREEWRRLHWERGRGGHTTSPGHLPRRRHIPASWPETLWKETRGQNRTSPKMHMHFRHPEERLAMGMVALFMGETAMVPRRDSQADRVAVGALVHLHPPPVTVGSRSGSSFPSAPAAAD